MKTTEQATRKVISAKEVYVGSMCIRELARHIRSDGRGASTAAFPPVPVIEEGTRTVPE